MDNIVIGIEGTVGSGKTTMCREMLKVIPNSIFLNGGNMYRAIVYVMMKNLRNLKELRNKTQNADIKMIMDKLGIEMKIENRETVFYFRGEKLEEEKLQSNRASLAVSSVGGIANNEKLFEFARKVIDDLKKEHTIILSGRSIMKIYPETDYHFFVTADLEERARRKASQYKTENIKKIKKDIQKRDELQAKAGFYDKSEKTIEVDVTNCKTPREAVDLLGTFLNWD